MSEFHNIKVKFLPYIAGYTFGTVELDGEVLHGVRDVKVDAGFQKVTEVTITLIAGFEAEFEDAVANVSEDVRA